MESKHHTARVVADSGIRVIIANGKRENVLVELFSDARGEVVFTEFVAEQQTTVAGQSIINNQ